MEKSKIRSFRKELRRFDRLNEIFNNACCTGITMAQCHALLEIEELGEATTIQLARNLLLDKSNLSRTIDSLVKRGLVKRKQDTKDRRYVMLILTNKGINLCNQINHTNDTTYSKMLAQLNQQEVAGIMDSFALLVKTLFNYIQDKNDENRCCER